VEPRLPSSKKKQDFPLDYIKMIRDVISKNFKKTKGKKVIVEGAIYNEEVCLRIGFIDPGAIKQVNFEASVDYSVKKKNIMEQIYLALDALGSLIEQYFHADGDIEVPKSWHEFKLDDKFVHLQVSSINNELESKAAKLLKLKVDDDKDPEDEN